MATTALPSENLRKLVSDFLETKSDTTKVSSELLIELCRYRYLDPTDATIQSPSNKDIFDIFKFKNQMQVTRLFSEAKKRNILQISVHNVETETKQERIIRELKKQYKHLREVYIVPSSTDHREIRRSLGKKAAEVLDFICKERGSISVSIGGGRTMQNFVHNIKEGSRSITISPLALFTRSEIGEVYDSAFLAMVVHWKSGEDSKAFVCALPPLPEINKDRSNEKRLIYYCLRSFKGNEKVKAVFEKSADPDVAFFGVADLTESSSIIARAYHKLDFTYEKLRKLGGIADMNYTVLSADGTDLSDEIAKQLKVTHKIHEHSHPFLLAVSIKRLRDLCKDEERPRQIFVVAGSSPKFKAIQAVVKAGIANCLITDEEIAERLASEGLNSIKKK